MYVGCVPKKVMYNAATIADSIRHYAGDYHLSVGSALKNGFNFEWPAFKIARDGYIKRLNGIYAKNLDNDGVESIHGRAAFISDNQLVINGDESVVYEAPHILIATGGKPNQLPIAGKEFTLDSDGFFDIENLPKKVAIVGAGYIAVEIAGVLNSLGSDVSLIIRDKYVLRGFDETLGKSLLSIMEDSGIDVVKYTEVAEAKMNLSKKPSNMPLHQYLTSSSTINEVEIFLEAHTSAGEEKHTTKSRRTELGPYNCVISAIGRTPNSSNLGKIELKKNSFAFIETDEYQNTSKPGIYAVGDVCGPLLLTPVAIAAGRRLADRLFGDNPEVKMDYSNVPTVVFSHPPIGTVGLTEEKARDLYHDQVKVYQSKFNNLFYGLSPAERKVPTLYKVVCVGKDEKVVGIHILGMASDEIMQGFGVAVKMGATKQDLDSCVAIHPTAAEELVTLR